MNSIASGGAVTRIKGKQYVMVRDSAEGIEIEWLEAEFTVNEAVIRGSINEFITKASNFIAKVEKFTGLGLGCKMRIEKESY
jgi:hypothetical protein